MPWFVVGFALLLLVPVASAQRLEPVGVLGNSGVAGSDLLRIVPTPQPSGVYVASDSTLWIDGGEALLHVTFDGRLIESHPLAPSCDKVNSWSFATLDGTLYFFGFSSKTESVRVDGREYRSRTALFALPLQAGARPRLVRSFPELPDHVVGALAAQPFEQRLLVAKPRTNATSEWIIGTVDPTDGTVADMIQPSAQAIAGLAWDAPHARLYVGGNWPQAHGPEIVAYDRTGRELQRTAALQTPANPTQFRGIVSLVGESLWEGAWYGHLGRWNLALETAPGTVWTWGLEFHYPCQLVAASPATPDTLVMSETDNQHTYLLRWDDTANRLTLGKRIGALAAVTSLAMSDDGWLTVGSGDRTLWWKWEDDAGDPPRAGNHVAGAVNGYFHEGRMVTLQPGKGDTRPVAITFEPHPGRGMSQPDYGQFTPFAAPAGLARAGGDSAVPNDHGWAYATDAIGNQVWRTRIEGRRGVPIAAQWKPLGGNVSLRQAGEIAVLPDGRLAVVDGGAVVFARRDGDQLVEERRLTAWGTSPAQALGPVLRLAAAGDNLLVADTSRHRVLWFDARSGAWLAQVGSTDVADTSVETFNRPTAVTLAGDRAVVYDSGNQRLVRLVLRRH